MKKNAQTKPCNFLKVEKTRHPLFAAFSQKETAILVDKRYCWEGQQATVSTCKVQPHAARGSHPADAAGA